MGKSSGPYRYPYAKSSKEFLMRRQCAQEDFEEFDEVARRHTSNVYFSPLPPAQRRIDARVDLCSGACPHINSVERLHIDEYVPIVDTLAKFEDYIPATNT